MVWPEEVVSPTSPALGLQAFIPIVPQEKVRQKLMARSSISEIKILLYNLDQQLLVPVCLISRKSIGTNIPQDKSIFLC